MPVIERREPSLKASWAAIDASLLDALARDRLGTEAARRRRSSGRSSSPSRKASSSRSRCSRSGTAGAPSPAPHGARGAAHRDSGRDRRGVAPAPGRRGTREPLSEAELRVVRYLPSNLKAPEIASELYVSSNTVRTHLRHIYAKLDAHNRTEAVARARELKLLAPGRATR